MGILCCLNHFPWNIDRKFDWRRANPFGALSNLKKYPAVAALIWRLTLDYLASHAIQSNWSYFTAYRFQWTPKTIGISLTVVGILVSFVQGVLIRVITPRIGNERSIYMGLLFCAIGMFLFAVANQSWMMFVFLIPYCLGGIAAPALQATITGHVPPNAQGELQGSLTSLLSITAYYRAGTHDKPLCLLHFRQKHLFIFPARLLF